MDLHINTVFQTFLPAISPSQAAHRHFLQEEFFKSVQYHIKTSRIRDK